MTEEIYVPYPFEVEPTDTITDEKAQVAKQLLEDINQYCEQNLTKPYDISRIAYASGIKVTVDSKDIGILEKFSN